MTRAALMERFAARVQVAADGCWLWMGTRFTSGYGELKVGGQVLSAHRLAWKLFRGPIPGDLFVCHACDVRPCVNPSHLFVGTQKDNMQDCVSKGRFARRTGEACVGARLTVALVRELRALPSLPFVQAKDLAQRWGVGWRHLYRVRSGEEWRAA